MIYVHTDVSIPIKRFDDDEHVYRVSRTQGGNADPNLDPNLNIPSHNDKSLARWLEVSS